MNPNQIAILASLINASITLDGNNNYVVVSPQAVTTTVSPSDVNEALNALAVLVTQTQQSLQTAPNAGALVTLVQTLQQI